MDRLTEENTELLARISSLESENQSLRSQNDDFRIKKNEEKIVQEQAHNLSQGKEEAQKTGEGNMAADGDFEALKENIKTLEEEKKVILY